MYSREYELVYVVRPDVEDDDVTAVQERYTKVIVDQGGTLLEVDDWGKRKLAYDIAKYNKGHYVLVRFLSEPTAIAELERNLRIDDRIMRFLTVKVGDRVHIEARIAEAEAKAAAAAAAAVQAEESESAGAAPA